MKITYQGDGVAIGNVFPPSRTNTDLEVVYQEVRNFLVTDIRNQEVLLTTINGVVGYRVIRLNGEVHDGVAIRHVPGTDGRPDIVSLTVYTRQTIAKTDVDAIDLEFGTPVAPTGGGGGGTPIPIVVVLDIASGYNYATPGNVDYLVPVVITVQGTPSKVELYRTA